MSDTNAGLPAADDDRPIPWPLWVPPPVWFGLAFVAGIAIQAGLGWPPWRSAALRWAGVVLANIGLLLAAWSIALFWLSRTTLLPPRLASDLVTRGPYRISRNPMYVALLSAYLGLALLHGRWGVLLLAPLPVLVLQKIVIPFEETRLRRLFGPVYAEYCQRVRRWL